jgi:tetraacyldisaccharide 4'-kinase
VISVGNLTVGGTGKTPVVAWLCRYLLERGFRPAVVSRGYGGAAGKGPVTVSTGRGPLIGPAVSGDEPYMLARQLAGISVVVGSDRTAGAARAEQLQADAVVLDDGFQHRRLARDLDIVLLDSRDPFGNGSLLPAGILREPKSSLRRADMVILTRCTPGEETGEIEDEVRRFNPEAPVLHSEVGGSGFVDFHGETSPVPSRAVAFCGIGSPGSFRSVLERCGVEIVEFHPFRDHHPYRPEEIERLRRSADAQGAALVTTEKDLARLERIREHAGGGAIVAPRIEIRFRDPALLETAVSGALGGKR